MLEVEAPALGVNMLHIIQHHSSPIIYKRCVSMMLKMLAEGKNIYTINLHETLIYKLPPPSDFPIDPPPLHNQRNEHRHCTMTHEVKECTLF